MQLKMQVQSEGLVLMLAFMIDLHEVLTGVSECFQADKTTLADVGPRVEFAIETSPIVRRTVDSSRAASAGSARPARGHGPMAR